MITVDQVRRLRLYPTSSWAIWNDDGADSVQFFEDNVGRLRNDVVFVGLNRSGLPRDWTNTFQNFHTPGHQGDRALKRLIQGQNLTRILGGYMTDLCDVFETNSGKVKVDVDSSGRRLEEQLEILNSARVDIVCFGEEVFKSLVRFYQVSPMKRQGLDCASVDGARPRSVFRVFHYAMTGFNNRKVTEELPGQLSALNAILEASATPRR